MTACDEVASLLALEGVAARRSAGRGFTRTGTRAAIPPRRTAAAAVPPARAVPHPRLRGAGRSPSSGRTTRVSSHPGAAHRPWAWWHSPWCGARHEAQ